MAGMVDDPVADLLRATPHPLLPWFSEPELRAMVASGDAAGELVRAYEDREALIKLASAGGDPLRYGFELDHWKDADRLLALQILFLIILGGNRSGKSEYAAKRIVQSALDNPSCLFLCLAEDKDTSIVTNQALIWKYLPPEIRAKNNKRDSVCCNLYPAIGLG